jgi:hypothetical protein
LASVPFMSGTKLEQAELLGLALALSAFAVAQPPWWTTWAALSEGPSPQAERRSLASIGGSGTCAT